MRASTSRIIYCIGLFALAACAVIPAPVTEDTRAVAVSAPLAVEVRLAQAVRDRIELEAALPARHADVVTAAATEDALRSLAFADDPGATRIDLIAALADQLSDALADRTRLASDETQKARVEKVISGLMGAINTEVHRNRI
ncbi:MAG: hypothetical protein R3C46_10275 [Hyphomonadaceae bacterium]